MATAAADTLGESVLASFGQLMGRDQVPLLLQDGGPVVQSPRGDLVVAPLVREPLERRLVAGVLLFAERLVEPEVQPQQIGVDPGGLVGVGLVEPEQALVQSDRLERHGRFVAAGQFPAQELVGGREDRAGGQQVEGVFGLGAGLFAGGVELERIVRQEIEHRRPVAVGDGAFLQQLVVRGHGSGFQQRFACQGLAELLVDLGQDSRQVPGGEVVAGRLGGGRSLQEPPAVLLEVVPVPVGQDRLEDRDHFLGRLGDLRFHADDLFLRLVAFDGAFQGNLLGDRLERFGVSLVLHRSGDDRLQVLDGRLWQAFADGFVDLLPLLVPRTGPSRHGEPQHQPSGKTTHRHPPVLRTFSSRRHYRRCDPYQGFVFRKSGPVSAQLFR